jgi:tetratricopeptide (TPR) repeat protein
MSSSSTSSRRDLLALIALALLCFAPSLRNGFIWDDDQYVTENVQLRSPQGLASIWLEPGSAEHSFGQYYPLVHTSFWIEHQLWGNAPLGYHAVNLLLHALGAVLLWRLLRRLELPGAWLAAALFAVHPVQVESVAWITERKNVLSGALAFASALTFLTWAGMDARRPAAAGRARWWLLSFALFVAALLAKTVTAAVPAALLLLLWWKRGRVTRRELAALLPFLLVGLALGLLTAQLERTVVHATGPEWELSALQRTLIAGRALWFYAGKLAWPAGLAFIYSRWDVGPGAALGWIALLSALALAAALWLARRRLGRGPLVAVLIFGGTLLPALGFVNVFPMRYAFVADHFQYLACTALLALAAAGLAQAGRGFSPRARAAGAAALLLLLAGISWQRQAAYRDAETLWRDTVRRTPDAWMAWNNLGLEAARQGRLDEALLDFEESLRLHPRHQQAETNLGFANLQLGRLEDAIAHYERALQLDPRFARAHADLGLALARAGRWEEASPHLQQALLLQPDDAELHRNLGLALAMQDRLQEAIAHHERALELQPDLAEAHADLGQALLRAGRRDEALAHWRRALELDPHNASALLSLGQEQLKAGELPEAIESCERALESQPESAAAHFALGVALGLSGRLPEALPHYERAVELQPGFPEAHYNLALALGEVGRREEAIEQDRLALEARPDWIEARVNLGQALLATGRFEEAATELQAALRLDPDVPETRFLLGTTLAQTGRISEAIAEYEAGLELRPTDVYGQLRLGQLLLSTGDARAALARFDEAVRLDADCAPALDAAARLRATSPEPALRDGEQALRLAQRACELTERRQVGPLDTLAAAFAETGRWEEAVGAAEEALVLARTAGPGANVTPLAEHLRLYESRSVLRETPGAAAR